MRFTDDAFWLCLLGLVVMTATLEVPNSPCPDAFRYLQGADGYWSGLVRVPAPNGLPMKVVTELYLKAALPSKYSGRLMLRLGKDEVLRQMRMGVLQDIDYKLLFPLRSPLPEVKRITANNVIVCEGPPVRASTLTTIRLEHSLFPVVAPLSPGKHPATGSGRPQPQQGGMNPEYLDTNGPFSAVKPPSEDTGGFVHSNNPFFFTKPPRATTVPPATPPPWQNRAPDTGSISCGRPIVPVELVLNGNRTSRGEWPWIAAIFTVTSIGQEFACSGSLLNRRTVITAGHCIKYRDNPALTPKDLVIYLGKYEVRRFAEPYSQVREVSEIYLHPDYNSNNFDADIAMIILRDPVEYTRYVLPICLWNQHSSLNHIIGQIGVVVGWGRDEHGNRVTDFPRKTNVPVVSREDCINSRKDFALITSERTFCGGFRNDTGPCSGDSGGGLFLPSDPGRGSDTQWFLRGIVSLSLLDPETQSCDLRQYIVFTDVAKFQDWILQIAQRLGDQP
ncbi:serine protease gd-like [Schistocerca piceifrons]|uniref:serine protease gd-like n=1 Tax=Schistocerca piceifrons TaxID=274613 RepID=UPI001F5F48D0|nr:serine protease gd-like [Schistocerca piceifrons]